MTSDPDSHMKGPSPVDPAADIPVTGDRQDCTDEPLAVGAKALARLLQCGLRTIRTWDASGRLPRPVRIGSKVIWPLAEIRAWLHAGAPKRAEWERRRRQDHP